jgi:hypothetical protein
LITIKKHRKNPSAEKEYDRARKKLWFLFLREIQNSYPATLHDEGKQEMSH